MLESKIKNYDELALFLNANMVRDVLGVSETTAYELMHQKNFPALKIGGRLVVPKDKFIEWVEDNVGK